MGRAYWRTYLDTPEEMSLTEASDDVRAAWNGEYGRWLAAGSLLARVNDGLCGATSPSRTRPGRTSRPAPSSPTSSSCLRSDVAASAEHLCRRSNPRSQPASAYESTTRQLRRTRSTSPSVSDLPLMRRALARFNSARAVMDPAGYRADVAASGDAMVGLFDQALHAPLVQPTRCWAPRRSGTTRRDGSEAKLPTSPSVPRRVALASLQVPFPEQGSAGRRVETAADAAAAAGATGGSRGVQVVNHLGQVYPDVPDPRTGGPVHFPDPAPSVCHGTSGWHGTVERTAGASSPSGTIVASVGRMGWSSYDIHHIRPASSAAITPSRTSCGRQASTPGPVQRVVEELPMTAVADVLARFAALSTPQEYDESIFRLASTMDPPATDAEVQATAPANAPSELGDLWRATRTARLFEDVDYGQWGLVILSPSASAGRTAKERARRPRTSRSTTSWWPSSWATPTCSQRVLRRTVVCSGSWHCRSTLARTGTAWRAPWPTSCVASLRRAAKNTGRLDSRNVGASGVQRSGV